MDEFQCGACGALVSGIATLCVHCGVGFEQPARPTRRWNDPAITDRGSSASTGARRSDEA